jgi:transposase-like protein
VRKPLRDLRIREVLVQHYRCPACRHTFRHYPAGVDKRDQSQRTATLAALLWALGLSTHAVARLLQRLEVHLSPMTVWRDVLLLVGEVQERLGQRQVRCLGVDGFWVRPRGQGRGLVVAVEMEEGLPLALLQVDERDPKALSRALAPLLERLGAEVLVTDDLPSYHLLAEEVGLRQQVCTFHLMRWASREVRRLEREVGPEGAPVLAQVRDILRERPLDGGRRLFPLWLELSRARPRPQSPLGRLKALVLRLAEGWERYCLHRRDPQVPTTNNRTEQAIGRFRIRAKGMRGIRSWGGLEAAFLLPHVQVA